MVRTSPSSADAGLIEYAASHKVEVSARQLERWRGGPDPLLPPNPRSRPGRPGGSTSTFDPAVGELAVWLGQRQQQGRRRDHLILHAFAAALADETPDRVHALAALGLTAQLRADLDAAEARLIDAARAAGASWSDIGATLGMTKQSATERRRRLAPSGST